MKIKHKYKYNLEYIIPITCIGILGILSFISIYPSISIHKTYADESDGYTIYDADNSSVNVDNNNATTYDFTEDGVVLEWDNRDSDYQTITGSNSEVLYRYNRFRVTAENIKKYQILANIADTANGTNGNKLTGYTNSEYNIPNGYSIDSISDTNGIVGKDLTSSTTSQWGYAITIGEVTTTDNLSNLTYKAVPPAASSDIGLTDNVTELNNQAFTIAFAANIADDKPAGSYRASVGVSVVVEPKELTIDDITTMQEMTPEICASMPYADTAGNNQFILRDKRVTSSSEPGYQYTVAHLKNGNGEDAGCWMTENLAIIDKSINSTDSDLVSGDFNITGSNIYGFNEGDKESRAVYYESGYGGYYNWYTATAGTGPNVAASNLGATIEASSSICPKGWKLPNRMSSSGSYSNLLDGLPTTSDTQLITYPYYFIKGGHIFNSAKTNTASGYYWSAVGKKMSYGTILADSLYFYSGQVVPTGERNGCFGFSIRCVAR